MMIIQTDGAPKGNKRIDKKKKTKRGGERGRREAINEDEPQLVLEEIVGSNELREVSEEA